MFSSNLVRMKTPHKEKDLIEYNNGMIFSKLKTDRMMQQRLQMLLNEDRKKMVKYIEKSQQPWFGCPPMIFDTQEKEDIGHLIYRRSLAKEGSSNSIPFLAKKFQERREE